MLAMALLVSVGTPTGTAAPGFDAARVQSKSCRPPAYRCGFQPPTADDLAAAPLADPLLGDSVGSGQNGTRLPARVDLSAQMPPVGDQGPHASGVAWALAYGLMSHGRAAQNQSGILATPAGFVVQAPARGETGRTPCRAGGRDADRMYSPADLYAALNSRGEGGIDLLRAGRHLVRQGALDCNAAPYDPDADRIAGPSQQTGGEEAGNLPTNAGAARFRARGLHRLEPSNLAEIQARLAGGKPVAIGLSIYEDFYQLGRGVYEVPAANIRERGFRGGHAVVLVGYDDHKKSRQGGSGAFRFLNSFSRDWGDRGYGWISYRAFRQLVRTAVILDFGEANAAVDAAGFAPDGAALPAPPMELVATRGHFADRIVLQFSESPGAVAYEISRAWPRSLSEDKARPFEVIGYSRETLFVDRGIQPDVAFRYRVRAIGTAGFSRESAAVGEGFTTKKSDAKNRLPLRVIGLRAPASVSNTAGGRSQVELSWNAATGAKAYRVMRFEVDRNRWRVLSRSQSKTKYLDRRPQRGAWNVYRVQAINDAGRAAWSESARVLIGGPGTPPATVARLSASRGGSAGRVTLTWDLVPGADRYRVYRFARPSGGASSGVWQGPFAVSGSNYVDELDEEAISEGGSYIAYRMAAGNAAGFSPPGPTVFGFARSQEDSDQDAEDNPAGIAQLTPPTTVRLQSTRRGVRLSWSPVAGAVEYYVLRKRAGEADFGFVGNVAAQAGKVGGVFQEEFPGEAGDLFLYTVRAKPAGADQESGDSDVAVAFQNLPDALSGKRKRFFWNQGDGIGGRDRSNFTGVWTAMDWDGESGPRRIEMRIVQDGPRFEGEYRIGNNPSRKFEGSYVYGSRVLETAGFHMQLLHTPQASGGALAAESIVRIDSRDLSPYDVELAFEKTGL